jgi:hypothetical protein
VSTAFPQLGNFSEQGMHCSDFHRLFRIWWLKDLPMPRIKVKAVFVSLKVNFKKAAQSLSVRVRTLQV